MGYEDFFINNYKYTKQEIIQSKKLNKKDKK